MMRAWEVRVYRTPEAAKHLGRYLVAAANEEGALRQVYLRTWEGHHCTVQPVLTEDAAALPYATEDRRPSN